MSLSSCAIHNKFPYICFLPGCVKNQLGITTAINKGKVLKKELAGKRKRRQVKRESKKNKTEGGIVDRSRPQETHEERDQRRKDEKTAKEVHEKQEQKTTDSLAIVNAANKKYLDPLAGENQKPVKPSGGDSLIIYYPVNVDVLSLPDKERIKNYIEDISKTKYNKIKIQGFTDNTGVLSKERAQLVSNYFEELGISKNKLFIEDKGSKDPYYDNSTDDGKRLNRRVVITLE